MEVLACPHCDRLFRLAPAVIGKKIRCRGCRQVFYVPKDTSSVPLGRGPDPAEDLREGVSGPPIAIPCISQGCDARCCPHCDRTFAMKPAFIGKVIRCRGCKAPFRVTARDEPLPKGVVAAGGKNVTGNAKPKAPSLSPNQFQLPPRPAPLRERPLQPSPTIFEDIGDVLDDLVPGENVASVVRPRSVPRVSGGGNEAVYQLIAVALGGLCAVPATMVILKIISKPKFDLVARMLPAFLTDWIP